MRNFIYVFHNEQNVFKREHYQSEPVIVLLLDEVRPVKAGQQQDEQRHHERGRGLQDDRD